MPVTYKVKKATTIAARIKIKKCEANSKKFSLAKSSSLETMSNTPLGSRKTKDSKIKVVFGQVLTEEMEIFKNKLTKSATKLQTKATNIKRKAPISTAVVPKKPKTETKKAEKKERNINKQFALTISGKEADKEKTSSKTKTTRIIKVLSRKTRPTSTKTAEPARTSGRSKRNLCVKNLISKGAKAQLTKAVKPTKSSNREKKILTLKEVISKELKAPLTKIAEPARGSCRTSKNTSTKEVKAPQAKIALQKKSVRPKKNLCLKVVIKDELKAPLIQTTETANTCRRTKMSESRKEVAPIESKYQVPKRALPEKRTGTAQKTSTSTKSLTVETKSKRNIKAEEKIKALRQRKI